MDPYKRTCIRAWACVCACVDTGRPIAVANVVDVFTCGEEKLLQPRRATKVSRSLARWILDISRVPARICGRASSGRQM